MKISNKTKPGIAALMTVVIVGAAALVMAFSAASLGLGDLIMGYDSQKSQEVATAGDGCLEETLYRLRRNPNYSGETLSFGVNSCIITIASSSAVRKISISASQGNYYSAISATSTVFGGTVSLDAWAQN